MKILKSICLPSLIYLIISLLTSMIRKYNIIDIIINVPLFTYLLNYICKKYGQNISWYILFILLILIGLNIQILDIKLWNLQ